MTAWGSCDCFGWHLPAPPRSTHETPETSLLQEVELAGGQHPLKASLWPRFRLLLGGLASRVCVFFRLRLVGLLVEEAGAGVRRCVFCCPPSCSCSRHGSCVVFLTVLTTSSREGKRQREWQAQSSRSYEAMMRDNGGILYRPGQKRHLPLVKVRRVRCVGGNDCFSSHTGACVELQSN